MKKLAITALILGVISISVLHAQSDFGPKKHHETDPIFQNLKPETSNNTTKSTTSYALPFTENFDDLDFPPQDWTTFIGTNGAGTYRNWTLNYGYNDYCAFVYYENLNGIECQDWLVTPQITLGENTSLSYFEKQSYTTDYGSDYHVMISTNSQTNHSDFTEIISYGESDFSWDWSQRIIDLSDYDGQDVYIAFVMINDDGDNWFVDNISITEDPGGGGTPGGDLLISEVAFPTDSDGENGRFVELINSGDTELDLGPYFLAFYKNTQNVDLIGSIAPGETFIYAPDSDLFYDCYDFYPDQSGGINSSWFNGTDAIYILEYTGKGSYQRRDTYGVRKTDGSGTEWEYSGMHAVRNPEVTAYQKNFDINEWEISSAYYSYRDVTPGNHNDIYYWTGSYNDEWDEYRNWTVNTGYQTIPDAGSNVVISPGTTNEAALGYYNFPYYFGSLKVESGASFTVKSYNILKISNDVNIENGGNLYLESDANGAAAFIPEGSVNGNIQVQRWFPSIGGVPTNGEWHYFTPSITDLNSNLFMDQFLMYWDEPATSWQYITSTNYILTPGVGYGVLLDTDFGNTINMTGNLVTGDVQSPTLNNTNGSGWQGWNLIGNPYSAAIDWEKVVEELPATIDVGIHYWDAENDQYVFYNNGNGTASQYIPPMQGFFIHTNQNNVDFTFPASARTYNGIDEFYKAGEGKPYETYSPPPRVHNNRLIINVSSQFGKTDKTYLEFNPKASEDFDFEFDALKFESSNDSIPEAYISYNSTRYAINTLPEESLSGRFDLCINYGLQSSYTLSFGDLESFDETQPILLYDKVTGDYYDLRQQSFINFSHELDSPENRFEIVFDNYLSTSILNPEKWLVYSSNGKLNIRKNIYQSNREECSFQVFSLDGKLLYQESFTGEVNQKSFKLPKNMYLIKLIDKHSQTTHKVYLYQ